MSDAPPTPPTLSPIPRIQAAQIRATLGAAGGRFSTCFIPMPDGTAHLEMGASQIAVIALQVFAAKLGADPRGAVPVKDHARSAVAAARELSAVLKAELNSEGVVKEDSPEVKAAQSQIPSIIVPGQ
jgi:hypothetical protein